MPGLSYKSDGRVVITTGPNKGRSHARVLYEQQIQDLTGRDCKMTDDLVVHHINQNPYDNRLENLAIMSRRQHARHHKLKAKRDKKGRWI